MLFLGGHICSLPGATLANRMPHRARSPEDDLFRKSLYQALYSTRPKDCGVGAQSDASIS